MMTQEHYRGNKYLTSVPKIKRWLRLEILRLKKREAESIMSSEGISISGSLLTCRKLFGLIEQVIE